jgi:SAM-dependent methyltransferase
MIDPEEQLAYSRAEALQWDEQADLYDRQRELDLVYLAGAEAAASALRPRTGDLVLDAGSGTGIPFKIYYQPGVRVVAVDLSHRSLHRLRESMPDAALSCVRGNLNALPFAAQQFDKVLCANALQHIPDDQTRRNCVRELARVARPSAKVVVSVHNFSMGKRKAGWCKEGPAGGHSGSVQYIYRFDHNEFQGLMGDAMGVECVFGAGLPLPYRFKLSPLSRRLERLLRRFPVSRRWGNMLVGVGRALGSTEGPGIFEGTTRSS